MINPIASVKKLSVNLALAADVPAYAAGDEKRLMQIILIVVGNAVKFTKEGFVTVEVSVARSDYIRGWQPSESHSSSDAHFYLRVQVKPFLSCSVFIPFAALCIMLYISCLSGAG